MIKLTGQKLADQFCKLLSLELNGEVSGFHNGKTVEISGYDLPTHPQYKWARSWTMHDKKTVNYCRQYLENKGCMGQYHTYDPLCGARK